MPELDDIALLKQFAENDSEPAFAGLVSRHVNLVYSTALRSAGNAHAAQEISQAVFIILARKAKSMGAKTVLSGWLYQTTRLTAANYLRAEIRRQNREQEAYMQSILNEPESEAWRQIAPVLDDAISKLGVRDRDAIVLRFFENKNLREVGAALGASEDAAKMRVNRALEKLRKFFTKRGATFSAAIIATAVSANSVHAAPAGLSVSTVAAIKGSAVSVSTMTLVKGTLKIMTYAKLKLAIGITAGILLAGGAATVVFSSDGTDDNLQTSEIFKKAQDTYSALTSYSDEGQTVATLNGSTFTTTFTIKLARPNLYLIEWQQKNESAFSTTTTKTEAVWSAGAGNFLDMGLGVQKQKDQQTALSSAAGISASASSTIPSVFFKMNGGNPLGFASGQKHQTDEKVGDADCYVFISESNGRMKTIWIGKQDFLIHQVRVVTSAEAEKAMLTKSSKAHPEIMASLEKMGFQGITSTETHTNIVMNPNLSATDFKR
jgi:RNA polymerase sigma factor (sigma-70 family)